MANIAEILYAYGSAARANYPEGDDVERDMDYIVVFIIEHGYEFQDDLMYELRRGLGLCPIHDVFKSFDRCKECEFGIKVEDRYTHYKCGFKG